MNVDPISTKTTPSSKVPEKTEKNKISPIAQSILTILGEQDYAEISEFINKLEKAADATQLQYFKAYVEHLHKLDPENIVIKNLVRATKVNEAGQSILTAYVNPVIRCITSQNIAFIKKLSDDPDTFLHWLKFEFAHFSAYTTSHKQLKDFLYCPLGLAHTPEITPSETGSHVNLNDRFITVENIVGGGTSIGLRYHDSVEKLFNDEQLLSVTAQFSEEYPHLSESILQWIRINPAETCSLLQSAMGHPTASTECKQILSHLYVVNMATPLSTINKLFQNPAFTKEKAAKFALFAKQYPYHIDTGALWLTHDAKFESLFLFQSEPKAAFLDCLSHFQPPDEAAMDLLNLFDKLSPGADLYFKTLAKLPKEIIAEIAKELVQSSDLLLVKQLLLEKPSCLLFNVVASGLLFHDNESHAKLRSLFAWERASPEVYESILGLFGKIGQEKRTQLFGSFFWICIHHHPKHVDHAVACAQGNGFALLQYLQHLFLTNPTAMEMLKNEQTQEEGSSEILDFSSQGTSLFKKMHASQLTSSQRRQCNVLIGHNRHFFCYKLLELFKKDSQLMNQLLKLAVDENEHYLAMKLLDKLQAHPKTRLSAVLRLELETHQLQRLKDFLQLAKEKSRNKKALQLYKQLQNGQNAPEVWQAIHALLHGAYERPAIQSPRSDQTAVENCLRELEHFQSTVSKLFSPDKSHDALATHAVAQIAALLIDHDGFVNLNRTELILQSSLSNIIHLSPLYLEHIKFVLQHLKEDPSLVEQLQKLTPIHNHPIAELMVRTSLGIPYYEPVTPSHLRQAALQGLLLHERQPKEVGSCVGASRLNATLKDPQRALAFLSEILTRGQVQIELKGQNYELHCHPRPNDEFLKESILFDENGILTSTHPFKALPGISKLAAYLGIGDEDQDSWIKSALSRQEFHSKSFGMHPVIYSTSHDILLKCLVLSAQDRDEKLKKNKALLACCETAYLSCIDNIPSRALEGLFVNADITTINRLTASLFRPFEILQRTKQSEKYDPNDISGLFLLQFVAGDASPAGIPSSLFTAWAKNEDTPAKRQTCQWVASELKKQLSNHFAIVYDPSAKNKGKTISGKILFDPTLPIEGMHQAVNDRYAFQQLCRKAANATIQEVEKFIQAHILANENPEFVAWWTTLKTEFEKYMGSDRYAKAVTLLFSGWAKSLPKMGKAPDDVLLRYDPLEHFDEFRDAPWNFEAGGINEAAWASITPPGFHETHWQNNKNCFHPEDLLEFILELHRIHDCTLEKFQHFAGGMPGHAINFDFSHPVVQDMMKSENPRHWIEENCVQRSVELAKIRVSSWSYKRVCNAVKRSLPMALEQTWEDYTENQPKEGTLPEIHAFLHEKLKECLGTDQTWHQAVLKLENELMCLILDGAPRFLPVIDTNWFSAKELKDIYFALVYSPFSLEWEMWTVDNKLEFAQKAANHLWFGQDYAYSAYLLA